MVTADSRPRSPSLFHLGCYAFVSLGVSAALLGPALPALAERAQTSLQQIGLIFTSMSLGYLLSAPVISAASRIMSTRTVLMISPLVVIASMVTLALGRSLEAFMLATFLLGLGQSGTQVSYNAIFGAEASGAAASARLNRLNAFFGVGALVGPLLVAAGYRLGDPAAAFWISALMALPLTFGAAVWTGTPTAQFVAPPAGASIGQPTNPLRTPALILMCLTMALYVGCEVAFSGWTAEFARRVAGVDMAQAAIAVSAFWLGLTTSRYFSHALVSRIAPAEFVFVLLAVSALGLAVMLLSAGTLWLALAGAFVVGLGCGPFYPTLVAIGIHRYPGSARLVASVLTSAGSLGAFFLPAVVGVAMSVQAAYAWSLLLAMFGVIAVLWAFTRRLLYRPDVTETRA
jgi:fucose permease